MDTQTYTLAEDAKLEAGKGAIQTADLHQQRPASAPRSGNTINGDTRVAEPGSS